MRRDKLGGRKSSCHFVEKMVWLLGNESFDYGKQSVELICS